MANSRPQSLVRYYPLFGRGGASGNEEDWVSGNALSQTSDPPLFDHPRIIYPARRSIFLPSAATGGDISVSVPKGELTLTGYAPTVVLTDHKTIAVPAGALTLTGYAPTVVASDHKTVAVPAGALTLTGYAPTVTTTADQTIAVPAGALTLTGYAPTVVVTDHKTVAVPAGALTLTGYAPTVLFDENRTIAVPAGSLTLTGYAPTVVVTDHKTIAVPAGALTLTGYAPTVLVNADQTIAVPKGELTLTGYAPSVLITDHKTIAVPKGTLELAGYAPTVRVYPYTAVRPDADTTPGDWLPSSAGSDLYAMIDEETTDDADYIYTESASTCRMSLGTMADPGVNYGHVFTYRIKGNGSATILARVGASATTVVEYTHASAAASLTTHSQTLTSGEVDTFRAAGGYADGWIEFEAA